MAENNKLVAAAATPLVADVWTQDQVQLIADTLAKDANLSPSELALFAQVCKRTELDPFRKQIYAVRYKANAPVTFQTGIDGFRVIAKRSGKLRGILAPEWCGEDGDWKDVWLSDEPPVAARVAVRHQDYDDPVVGIALYKEYVATRFDQKLQQYVPNSQWTQRPAHMLAKCAEALAIRRAFPDDVGGVYTDDEMEQASNAPDAPAYIDHETGEYVEQAEIFGSDEVTIETLVDHARERLRELGLDPKVLRQALPWEGRNVREGLENWARQNPNEELLKALDEALNQWAYEQEEESLVNEQQGAAQEAQDAAHAEAIAEYEEHADEGRLL